MSGLTEQMQRLAIGSVELSSLVGWPESLIEDYLGIQENFLALSEAVEKIGVVTDTPATASSTGTTGNIAIDSDYFYVCVATDTWKRVGISTW